LALLAAEVRSGGHFDKIIIMIDKMIADLRVEEKEDIAARDMCNNQENALKAQGEQADYMIEKKKGVKERQEAKKAETEASIIATQDEITMANETMNEMLAARNKESADFKKALKDDVDAVALLEQAIAAITKFYTDNKIPLEFIQQEPGPEYTVDEDKAPEASFGGPRKSESTGIIAILSMLKEDLEKEIAVAREEEAAAEAEYDKMMGEAREGMDALKEKETTLKGEKAELDAKIADTDSEIEGQEEVKDNTEKQKDALKPSCEWVKNTFDSRREKRKAEIAGLEEAKALLAGARPEFLQGHFLHRTQ
jgi:chromosome segregation ATPase